MQVSKKNITSITSEQISSKLDNHKNKNKLFKNSNQSDTNMSTNAFDQTSSALICGKYKSQTLVELREAKTVKQYKSCNNLGDISPAARKLLHYHNKLEHMGFDKLKT